MALAAINDNIMQSAAVSILKTANQQPELAMRLIDSALAPGKGNPQALQRPAQQIVSPSKTQLLDIYA